MIYQTIGRNMKRFRQENHMTQSELANLLFVSPQMISRYENNSAVPDIATLAKICCVFHVSLDILCGMDSTSKEKHIQYLLGKYSNQTCGSFSILNETYENFVTEASEVLNDDRILRIQLVLLGNLHDNIENDEQHTTVNERIFDCTSRILDISQNDELRSLANYRMALYYWETPFEAIDYQNNLEISKEYLKNVLISTYFPDYIPTIGANMQSDEYQKVQLNHIEFFAKKLYRAIKQVKRSEMYSEATIKYDKLFSGLEEIFESV